MSRLAGPLRRLRRLHEERAVRAACRRLTGRALPPAPGLDLSLAIPVRDDAAGLARLLERAGESGLFREVVVVDDGSVPPLDLPPGIHGLRHPAPLGGGIARNRALARVTGEYVLFLDADDLPTPELDLLVADLAEEAARNGPFDLCLFKHADDRVRAEPRWGQPDWDDLLWQEAGHGTGALRPAAPCALPVLARTANYPWNKIFRTAFLRENGIGCAPTPVHQDIPLHWLALVAARRALVSDRICVWHRIDAQGTRLSNRRGAERLELFAALDMVLPAAGTAGPDWRRALAAFVPGLADWAARVIDPALLPRLRAAEAGWTAANLLPWAEEIAAADPDLALLLRDRARPAR